MIYVLLMVPTPSEVASEDVSVGSVIVDVPSGEGDDAASVMDKVVDDVDVATVVGTAVDVEA